MHFLSTARTYKHTEYHLFGAFGVTAVDILVKLTNCTAIVIDFGHLETDRLFGGQRYILIAT